MADRRLMVILGGKDDSAPPPPATPSEDGYYNLQNVVRAINSIKPVTNRAARVLIYQGQTALDKARSKAAESIKASSEAHSIIMTKINRDSNDVGAHLTWHADRIGADDFSIYPNGDDLKKYVIMAFTVYNEAYEGVKTAPTRNFFFEAMKSFADVLQRTRDKLTESVFPKVAVVLGVVAVGLVGYGWWSLKMVNARRSLPKDGF